MFERFAFWKSLLFGAIIVNVSPLVANEFALRDDDRIVLLGGTFIERMQAYSELESLLLTSHPNRRLTFRNLGWSGDTVWGDARAVFGKRADGFKRLVDDVTTARPTVILVAYGANESFEGKAGVANFEAGLITLLNSLEKVTPRLVLVTPHRFENVGLPLPDHSETNKRLATYSEAIRKVAESRGHTIVDLFASSIGTRKDGVGDTENGIHLTAGGYRRAAREIARVVGGLPSHDDWNILIDAKTNSYSARGTMILDLARTSNGLNFASQSDRLSVPRPYSLEPRYRTLQVRGLEAGDYSLRIDGKHVLSASDRQFAQGVTVSGGPQRAQMSRLLDACRAKNELYFHRYRPQNETYLFLFRKHEQGNNAVEIPQFEPLVAVKDKAIHELASPQKHVYQIVRVPI